MDKMKRYNVFLPHELIRAIQKKARQRKWTMADTLRELLRLGLDRIEKLDAEVLHE